MAEAHTILDLLADKANVDIVPAAYRGLDGTRVVVDFSGGRVPAYAATPWRPELNEPVWVAVVDGVAYMLGPTIPKPGDGTIVSVTAGLATVQTDIGTVQATYGSGVTLTAGQLVKLMWSGGCHVVDVKSTTPVDPVVPPAPTGGSGPQTRIFTAIDSGSYQAGYGWRTSEVWCSASNRGCWFYGSQIADTIPDGATIQSAEIWLPTPRQLLGARPFGRHAYGSKPAGAPTITATANLGGTSGWVGIPTTLIDWLKVNVGGLGFDLGGYNIWPGGGQSGAVRVTYQ
jgi:hypothetical protein